MTRFWPVLLLLPLVASANDFKDSRALKQLTSGWILDSGIEQAWLERQLMDVERQPRVLELFKRQFEDKPWYEYRRIFDTQERAFEGVTFWREHEAALTQAEVEFGVPASIIVAIIGVETRFGQRVGSFPVLDTLLTLAFEHPRRQAFFSAELDHFIKLTWDQRLEAKSLMGSYAGAMGIPQFMPSSFRAYAIDFDGDGTTDIWNSAVDAIGSVAAYLKRNGWRQGEPIVAQAILRRDVAMSKGLKRDRTLAQLREQGVEFGIVDGDQTRALLFELEGADGKEYYVGLNNFYVLTRYNRSTLYAMAVERLAQRIQRAKLQ
ncbi:MAG: lytic murein transglycosylase B [Litorivicinus sp.]